MTASLVENIPTSNRKRNGSPVEVRRIDQYTEPIGPRVTILDRIETFLDRFVIFPDPAQRRVLALWVLHTHAFDGSYATPYIYVTSAEPESGKTRVMEVLALLARNSIDSANVTASSLFRRIDAEEPTVFIDEVDAIFTGTANEELRGMLNSGYKRNGRISRTVGNEVIDFGTFCPKLLAGIDNGKVPDTINSRSIRIVLKRKRKDQNVERFIPRKVEPQAAALKAHITQWADDNSDALLDIEPEVIDELGDRAFEISEPLLAVAERVGRRYLDEARAALITLLSNKPASLSIGQQVLKAAHDILEASGSDRIASAVLAEATHMHPKRLGHVLAPFDIKSKTLAVDGVKMKAYFARDFADAFERYL